MADIKTHLRELSVAITIGLLRDKSKFNLAILYDSKTFLRLANELISSKTENANNLLIYEKFPNDLQQIINNGYKLGKQIYNKFNINPSDQITWIGNDTQKGDPIDITIGKYAFSLKEQSFILKNMGLYQFLNNLTGSTYKRGLHIFKTFAREDYEIWFNYTWKSFYNYLHINKTWYSEKNNNISEAYIDDNSIILKYNKDLSSIIPISIKSTDEYMKYTTSKTREKVFSKWINSEFSKNETYNLLKRKCSEAAGKTVSNKISTEFSPNNVYDFFQICENEYYYAKTTSSETTILKVPSSYNFNSQIKFKGCRFEVPTSQLNIITTFQNEKSGKTLEFRNECRFSHGQFNGTPEAKMYIVKNTQLDELYEKI